MRTSSRPGSCSTQSRHPKGTFGRCDDRVVEDVLIGVGQAPRKRIVEESACGERQLAGVGHVRLYFGVDQVRLDTRCSCIPATGWDGCPGAFVRFSQLHSKFAGAFCGDSYALPAGKSYQSRSAASRRSRHRNLRQQEAIEQFQKPS
jgi:hypothetical protein